MAVMIYSPFEVLRRVRGGGWRGLAYQRGPRATRVETQIMTLGDGWTRKWDMVANLRYL